MDAESYYKRGNEYLDKNENKKAIKCFNKTLEINPSNIKALNNKGVAFLNLGDFKKALDCFDDVLKVKPEDLKAITNKGRVFILLEDYEKSLKFLNDALKINNKDPYAWSLKGSALLVMELSEKALESFEKAIYMDPNDLDATIGKGFALLDLGERRKALDCFDDILKINPEDIDALYFKGLALSDLEQYKEALECYENILKIEPKNVNALIQKSNCLYAIKKPKKALESIEIAIKIEPENAEAWHYKGVILTETLNEKGAMVAFNTALKLEPDSEGTWVYKGNLYRQMKNYEKSLECFEKAIEINPDYAEVWFEKGNVLRQLGNDKKSREAYAKFVEVGKKTNIEDQVMVRRVKSFLKDGSKKKSVTFSQSENPQYWQWITKHEHFLNSDGTEADWLEPEPDIEYVPGSWWGGAHKDTILGDLILLYRAGNYKGKKYSDIKYLIQAESDGYLTSDIEFAAKNGWKYACDFKPIYKFKNSLTYKEIMADPFLKDWNARKKKFMGSAFKTEPQYWKRLLELLGKKNPDFKEFLKKFDPKKEIDKIITEKEFEDKLSKKITIMKKFGYDLELIGQQQTCEGQGGYIDLYCKDKSNDGFVVIELKITKANRNTFGQISDYMGWVMEKKAGGKPVAGIVISKGYDNSFLSTLRTSKNIKHIELAEILNELGLELK